MKNLLTLVVILTFLFAFVNLSAGPDSTIQKKVDSSESNYVPDVDEFTPVDIEPQVDLTKIENKAVYPAEARRAGIQGTVVVRALVGKNGKIIKSIIQSSDDELLNKPAQDAVEQTKFSPAIYNGKAILCWVSIPITFKLK